jgi:LPXTG-motif cell wall-anchored protein
MRSIGRFVLMVAAMVCLTTERAAAQSTATTTDIKEFEVIAVNGNDLVVKVAEGTRELKVPDDFRFTVNGQSVPVHELKPGMKGTATITTRTTMTPVTVTEIKEGTVAHATANAIIVRTADGMKEFTQSDLDKRGVKLVRDGKPAELSEFRSGDKLSATIVTTMPPRTVTEREVQATLAEAVTQPDLVPPPLLQGDPAPAAPTAPREAPVATSGVTAAQEAGQGKQLPATASSRPLIGLLGLAALAAGAMLAARRRHQSR